MVRMLLVQSTLMSWTSNGFFRNVNILARLDTNTGSNRVPIYQPGTKNLPSALEGVRYSGFLTSLRLAVDITSIAEVSFPTIEPGMSDGEISALMAGISQSSPQKQLSLWLESSDSEAIRIAAVTLYNRRPYYSVDLLFYLTDAPAFDIASDAVLSLQIENAGFGLLQNQDQVTIIGSAVEEGENTAPSLNITVLGGGGSGPSPSNAVASITGDVVTTVSGEVITT